MMFQETGPRLPRLADVDAELTRLEQKGSDSGHGLSLLVVSLMVYFGAQQTFGARQGTFLALLVLVLLLHELGHLAAMRLFGFRDLRMFFIPFFGAAAAGKKPDATGTQRAIVALAGPLPGIVLGCAGLLAVFQGGVEIGQVTAEFLWILLVLNFFNLLPIVPFDGGRFVSIVLFSRWPTADMVFRLVTSGALVWLAVERRSWVLGAVGVFVALGASVNAQLARIALDLRARIAAPRPLSVLDLPSEVRQDMLVAIAPIFTRNRGTPEDLARVYARLLTGVWGRVLDAPPGPLASAVLSTVYAAFTALGVALYVWWSATE